MKSAEIRRAARSPALLFLLLTLLGPLAVAATMNDECVGLLAPSYAAAPPRPGYWAMRIRAKARNQAATPSIAERQAAELNLQLIQKMDHVLKNNYQRDFVLFVKADSADINPKAMAVLGKGVALNTVDEFFPGWRDARNTELRWYSLLDPMFMNFNVVARGNFDFDLWLDPRVLSEVMRTLEQEVPEAEVFDPILKLPRR